MSQNPNRPRQQQAEAGTAGQLGSATGKEPLGVTPTGRDFKPSEVEQYLQGLDYPASRSQLIDCVIRNGARREIVGALENLPDQPYRSPEEVAAAVGQLV